MGESLHVRTRTAAGASRTVRSGRVASPRGLLITCALGLAGAADSRATRPALAHPKPASTWASASTRHRSGGRAYAALHGLMAPHCSSSRSWAHRIGSPASTCSIRRLPPDISIAREARQRRDGEALARAMTFHSGQPRRLTARSAVLFSGHLWPLVWGRYPGRGSVRPSDTFLQWFDETVLQRRKIGRINTHRREIPGC